MQEDNDPIADIVAQTLGFFVEEYKPVNIAFPILPNTYSLWRQFAYKKVKELPIFSQN